MKKITVLTVLIFLGLAASIPAQTEENQSAMGRFGISWSLNFIIQPDVFQRIGSMGVNFQVFDNGKLHIRNHILYNGGVFNMEAEGIRYTKHSLSEKITVGTITHEFFHTYGYFEGGLGTCGLESGPPFKSKVFENPLYGSVELGAGFEVLTLRHLSFFTEIGFCGNISELFKDGPSNSKGFTSYDGGFMMQQRIQLGLRAYL